MSDISLLSKDQVLALLNADNPGKSFDFTNIAFGTPTAATGVSPARDTELVITGIPGKGYKDSVTILYDRIDLAAFGTEPAIQVLGDVTLANILAGFNQVFGSNLQLDDIRSDLVPPADISGGGVLFTMIAAAGSYAYRGQITLALQPADVSLTTAVTNTTLTGLTYTPV